MVVLKMQKIEEKNRTDLLIFSIDSYLLRQLLEYAEKEIDKLAFFAEGNILKMRQLSPDRSSMIIFELNKGYDPDMLKQLGQKSIEIEDMQSLLDLLSIYRKNNSEDLIFRVYKMGEFYHASIESSRTTIEVSAYCNEYASHGEPASYGNKYFINIGMDELQDLKKFANILKNLGLETISIKTDMVEGRVCRIIFSGDGSWSLPISKSSVLELVFYADDIETNVKDGIYAKFPIENFMHLIGLKSPALSIINLLPTKDGGYIFEICYEIDGYFVKGYLAPVE